MSQGRVRPGAPAALWLQFLPDSPERRRQIDLDPGDAPQDYAVETPDVDEAWNEARALAETIEDHELVDPTLSSERLLFRLFHERGVKGLYRADGPRRVPLFAGSDSTRCCDASPHRSGPT